MSDIDINELSQTLLDSLGDEPFGKSLFTIDQGGIFIETAHYYPKTMVLYIALANNTPRLYLVKVGGGSDFLE